MSLNRIPIPNEVKRILRQEAGFGCCRCGDPFVEYHHIIQYSDKNHNNPEDMMTVCPKCHYVISSGAISEEEQRNFKKNPYNLTKESVYGEIFLRQNTINVGGSNFRNNGPIIVVDNEPIISTYHDLNGNLLLSLSLYDKDDNLLAKLVHNEWLVRPDKTWDLEAKPKSILVRQARRKISLNIKLVNNKVYLTGTFWKNKHLVELDSTYIKIGPNNSKFGICDFSNCYVKIDTENKTSSVVLGGGLHPNQPY